MIRTRWYVATSFVHALAVVSMGAVAGCTSDSPPAVGIVTTNAWSDSSISMPNNLRAAYIVSVQEQASSAYAATTTMGRIHLDNPAQRFSATIDREGLRISGKEKPWQWAMRTVAVGCNDAMALVSDAAPNVRTNRVDLRRKGLEEWYLNGPLGVEQGFVMRDAPACTGPKSITMALEGDLAARLEDSDGDGRGDAAKFVDRQGNVALAYTDLFVTDATGKTLPAWLSIQAGQLALVVDDRAAEYPLMIDPLIWTEQAKFWASDGKPLDLFGRSVSLSGNTALVGAMYGDGMTIDQGAAIVFVRNGTMWTQQAKLVANDGAAGDWFGLSVSLEGDTAVVGAPATFPGITNQPGAAYVFVRNGTTWTQQAKLAANDGLAADGFGRSVSVSGDTAVVGATADDVGMTMDQGSAYIFVRNGMTWAQQAKLVADDGAQGDEFGWASSLSGNTAIVGAFGKSDKGYATGAAYAFVRNGTSWAKEAKLVASDGLAGDDFGYDLFLSGNKVVIGARSDDIGANMDQGSAYVFVRNGTTWMEEQKLVATDGSAYARLGSSVSLAGNLAVAGAPNTESAYVFLYGGTMWTQNTKLVAGDGAGKNNAFGEAVSLSGNTVVVGAHQDDITNIDQGSAYIFVTNAFVGDTCATSVECASGFCIDGVCCDSACGNGDPQDCQACSIVTGAIMNGTCAPLTMGTVCRAAAGDCDAPEACDGTAKECPADLKITTGLECRAVAGDCDVAETCDGAANDCPANQNAPDGTSCMDGICTSGICIGVGGTGGQAGNAGAGGADIGGNAGAGGADIGGNAGAGGADIGGNAGAGGADIGGNAGAGGANLPSNETSCACRTVTSDARGLSVWPFSLVGMAFVARRRRRFTDSGGTRH